MLRGDYIGLYLYFYIIRMKNKNKTLPGKEKKKERNISVVQLINARFFKYMNYMHVYSHLCS